MLGLFDGLKPRFVKRFAELGTQATQAIAQYVAEVRSGEFPAAEHTYEDKVRSSGNAVPQSSAPAEDGGTEGGGYLASVDNGKE